MEDNKSANEAGSLELTDDNVTTAPADGAAATTDVSSATPAATPPPEKRKGIKVLLRVFNVYFLMFLFVVLIAGVVSVVSFLNSKKTPDTPNIINQNLTADQLKQLATSNTTVGNTGQTLTVQGNAIFSGQVLTRGDLSVAGAIKLGGDLTSQNFTASGNVNLAGTQAQSLQVANNTTLQGTLTVQKDLNVAGPASFNGPITANQMTVTTLIISGNGQLRVPNHIAFTGPTPGRSVNQGALGAGGTASVSGSDSAGTISINTGSGTAPGCFVTLNFNRAYAATPHVTITPIGAAAGQTQYYVNRNTTSMSVCTVNPAPANQNFGFDYFITG
jgi:cytoskeletal protein CcmA (bactofilin family)